MAQSVIKPQFRHIFYVSQRRATSFMKAFILVLWFSFFSVEHQYKQSFKWSCCWLGRSDLVEMLNFRFMSGMSVLSLEATLVFLWRHTGIFSKFTTFIVDVLVVALLMLVQAKHHVFIKVWLTSMIHCTYFLFSGWVKTSQFQWFHSLVVCQCHMSMLDVYSIHWLLFQSKIAFFHWVCKLFAK